MSPIVLLSIALQIACAVHVVRTGRPMYWIFILLIGSYIAVAIYLIAEVIPGMRNSPGTRKAVRDIRNKIDPGRQQREAGRRVDLVATTTHRSELAAQALQQGDFKTAEEQYRAALKGLYATDPYLMLGLAQAQFGLGQPQQTRQTLDALIAANPDFRSSQAHLLYARALEAVDDNTAALHEYETLAVGYPGEEARARFGVLLKKTGQHDKARELFSEVIKRANVAPRHYQREQREWIDLARRELEP